MSVSIDIDKILPTSETTITSLSPDALQQKIIQAFPGAVPEPELFESILQRLLPEPYYFSTYNTIYVESICSDEINHITDGLSSKLRHHYGGSFHLGGLAGIPLGGASGWNAFAHHVPDDGNLIVLLAPHIGISPDGHWGKIKRKGQSSREFSTACGAGIGARVECEKKGTSSYLKENSTLCHSGSYDTQMCYITQALHQHLDQFESPITTTSSPTLGEEERRQIDTVRRMYEIAWDYLVTLIDPESKQWRTVHSQSAVYSTTTTTTTDPMKSANSHHYKSVCILSGIQINTNSGVNYFQPLKWAIQHPNGFTEFQSYQSGFIPKSGATPLSTITPTVPVSSPIGAADPVVPTEPVITPSLHDDNEDDDDDGDKSITTTTPEIPLEVINPVVEATTSSKKSKKTIKFRSNKESTVEKTTKRKKRGSRITLNTTSLDSAASVDSTTS